MKVYVLLEDYRDKNWDVISSDIITVYDNSEKAKNFLDSAENFWWEHYPNTIMQSCDREHEGWRVIITDSHNGEYEYKCIEMEVK